MSSETASEVKPLTPEEEAALREGPLSAALGVRRLFASLDAVRAERDAANADALANGKELCRCRTLLAEEKARADALAASLESTRAEVAYWRSANEAQAAVIAATNERAKREKDALAADCAALRERLVEVVEQSDGFGGVAGSTKTRIQDALSSSSPGAAYVARVRAEALEEALQTASRVLAVSRATAPQAVAMANDMLAAIAALKGGGK